MDEEALVVHENIGATIRLMNAKRRYFGRTRGTLWTGIDAVDIIGSPMCRQRRTGAARAGADYK